MAEYLVDFGGVYPASYSYVGQSVGGGVETPPYATNGYIHWSSFLYGRKDLSGSPGIFASTYGWEAFTCPSINNGGLPADDASAGNTEPGQTYGDDGTFTAGRGAPYTDLQAPRMAYTANEAIMGRNKYVVGFQGCIRTYQFVKASAIKHSADTILVTEFNQDWDVVNDMADDGSGNIVCKSHRPVNAYETLISHGQPARTSWIWSALSAAIISCASTCRISRRIRILAIPRSAKR